MCTRRAADFDSGDEQYSARRIKPAQSDIEREAAKALGELSRVQAELRALAPRSGGRSDGGARPDDEDAEEEEDDFDAEQLSAERRGTARSRSATPAARAKGALSFAESGAIEFGTPAGGAGSRARRAAALAASGPGTPRSGDGRAPDKLGLHRIEHATASLAEKMREFEAANSGKPVWRSPGTPGGVSGAPHAARPRTAGARGAGGAAVGNSFGGYSEMLVEMATKLLGYLSDAEARVKAEEAARKQVTSSFEKRLAALEATATAAQEAAAKAQAELDATRKSHGATLDALVSKVRAFGSHVPSPCVFHLSLQSWLYRPALWLAGLLRCARMLTHELASCLPHPPPVHDTPQ